MHTPFRTDMRGRWRRRLFWIWIVVSALVAVYIGIGGPLADYLSTGRETVAAMVPAVMSFLLATGLGWLVLPVTAKRSRR
jgi:uncharacterized membrane protein YhaH (DUF805 family)